jgi:iron-sulfur cluster assembly protein
MTGSNAKLLPVTITQAAIGEVKSIFAKKQIPDNYGLRIGTSGGGCSGVSYIIGFDIQHEKDDVFFIEGITILIDKKHAMFLWGIEVDFVDKPEERGFVFNHSDPF